ncbi:hypothetical protein LWX53_02500 [bacterium]|nr:hypothetical protein [bacterium]
MKKHTIQALALALMAVLLLGSCDLINSFIASRTRNIAVIQIYNSNKEKTNRLLPNDTLFVEVQGLAANGFYKVECLDPVGEIITAMTAQADANGVISPSPLWYDIGFKKDPVTKKPVLPETQEELGVRAFNIHVVSLDETQNTLSMTDFKLPFYVVFDTSLARPQPIVMAGYQESGEFVLENSFEAGTDNTLGSHNQLWVKVANVDPATPVPQIPASSSARVYVVAYKGDAYEDGETIPGVVLYQDFTLAQLTAAGGVQITANDLVGNGSWSTIPTWARGKPFSVIVDFNNNGAYDIKKEGADDYFIDGIDGNMVAGFVVKGPKTTDYIPANIASGGIYHYDYATWQYEYDYRNQFKIEGLDTRYAWDWQFGGYGVKATWNPYINWGYGATTGANTASLYYGSYVDVYIIDSQARVGSGKYPEGGTITASDNWNWKKITLPVQYSCYNGCGQQTIWRADGDADGTNGGLVLGNYDVVVDVDRSGTFTKGDIIDDQPQHPNASFTPRNVSATLYGGFSVVSDYVTE